MALFIRDFLLFAITIYSYMLFIWVIGSWFPQFTVSKFYRFLDKMVYPFAKIFRGIIPPIGGFDLSVIIAFLVLQYVLPMIIIKLSSFLIMPGA